MIKNLIAFVSRLSLREKVVFYGAVIVVSMVLLDMLVLGPVLALMASLDEETEAKGAEVRDALEITSRKESLEKKINMYRSYLEDPGGEDKVFSNLLQHVTKLGEKAGVELEGMATRNPREDTRFRQYPLEVKCKGTMEQIVGFFYEIEGSDKLLRIERFRIDREDVEDSPGASCTINLSLHIVL